ncbi:Rho family guanine nucleotide exchange factor [Starmerella bacillaris]|uniref:Rho family guanine nucleotide exchange factor n=1 Tax=Starmerella bacillaris TaxID=1247836 RepID=A0AAV5RL42_STABA|nr:Rho family guanine nucleotide exchange factor [Starmerella bacillaris]
MNRASNGSQIGTLSTPTATRSWGSQRPIELKKQLYPRAAAALQKLRTIPGFDEYETFAQQDFASLPQHLHFTLDVTPAGKPIDPVSLIFRIIRMGAPLSLVFNSLNTKIMLDVLSSEDCRDVKLVKRSIYRFCESCVQDLGYKWDTDLFTISQVFHESISELLKPLSTLEAILNKVIPNEDKRISEELNSSSNSADSEDQLSKVCNELLQTERKYVQDLELLQVYHDEILNLNIPRETADKITPHIAKLLDFHRRFLVGCEYQIRLPKQQQNFGWLFLHLRPDFDICKIYTLSQKEATRTALNETNNLITLSNIFEPIYELPATLLKPVQRIMRYPLLIKEIAKNTPSAWPNHNDLLLALDTMNEMMSDVNETQRRAENTFIKSELEEKVKDWKGLDLTSMGELLLSGSFPATAEGEQEQEYSLYLFERVLLCCKDRANSKKTPLTKMRTAASRNSQGRSLSLDIKGRIYLEYINTVQTTKLAVGWLLRLSWGHHSSANEQGTFDVRLANEELAQMWEGTIQKLIALNRDRYSRYSRTTSVSSQNRLSHSSMGNWSKWITSSAGSIEDESGMIRGALFYDESSSSTSPMEALRKLSVSSTNSQVTLGSNSGGSGSRSSYPTNHANHLTQSNLISTFNSNASMPALGPKVSRPHVSSVDSFSSVVNGGQRKVRIHIHDDAFLILVPPAVSFEQLHARVERKLRLCGKMPSDGDASKLCFTYKDEDDDLVALESSDDLQVALDSVQDNQELVIYVK